MLSSFSLIQMQQLQLPSSNECHHSHVPSTAEEMLKGLGNHHHNTQRQQLPALPGPGEAQQPAVGQVTFQSLCAV